MNLVITPSSRPSIVLPVITGTSLRRLLMNGCQNDFIGVEVHCHILEALYLKLKNLSTIEVLILNS